MAKSCRVRQLGDVAHLFMGETIIGSECSGSGIPIFSADTGNFPWRYSHHPGLRLKRGTIIVGARGTIGRPRMPDFDEFSATQTTIVVVPDERLVYPRYLFHVLAAVDFTRLSAQQAIPMLTIAELATLDVRLPERGVRLKCAAVLDTIDEAVAKGKALIAKLKEMRAGLLHDLLSRGLDEDGQLRDPVAHPEQFQDSCLGQVPKDWDVKFIDDIGDVTKLAGFEFTNIIRYSDAGEIIALRALNIKDEKLDLSDIQRIPKSASDSLPRSKIFAGDVLITYIGAYIGDVLLIAESERFHLAPNIAKVTARDGTSPEFLQWQLRSARTRKQIRQLITTTATPSLTMTQIRRLVVGLPHNIEEQRNICGRISHFDNVIRAEEMIRDKAILLKSGLMSDLLTGRVHVPERISARG